MPGLADDVVARAQAVDAEGRWEDGLRDDAAAAVDGGGGRCIGGTASRVVGRLGPPRPSPLRTRAEGPYMPLYGRQACPLSVTSDNQGLSSRYNEGS